MAWLRKILKIYLEEQILIKYYVIKHLTLLNIQKMMDINVDLLQWFIIFSIKSLLCLRINLLPFVLLKLKVLAEELHKPIIRKFENKNYTHHL